MLNLVLPSNYRPGQDDPVPNWIMDDPWIIFHGTPATNCVSIDSEGIRPEHSNRLRPTILKLISIFETMRWHGTCGDGYVTLKTFSLSDFQVGGDEGVVFFSANFDRSLRYCHPKFGGSEKARAVCLAFGDLRDFLEKAEVRAEYNREKDATITYLQSKGAHSNSVDPHRFRFEDLQWLEEQLTSLDEHFQMARTLTASTSGAVYALKMTEADLSNFRNGGSMGIYTKNPVSLQRIICKFIVPEDQKFPMIFQSRVNDILKENEFLKMLDGVRSV